jgi:hypothetical protein
MSLDRTAPTSVVGELPLTRKAAQMVWEKVLTPEPPVKEAPLKVMTLLREAEKSSKQISLVNSWLSDKAITVLLVLLLPPCEVAAIFFK